MSEFVIDASALALAVTSTSSAASALRRRVSAVVCHAPHLVDAEVGNVLRRRELAGAVAPATTLTALRALPDLVDHRYAHTGGLAEAAWRLRGSITFYDALYVALADALRLPLVTSDGRLTRAPNLPCVIERVTGP